MIVLLTAKLMKHPIFYEDCLKLTFLILTPAYLIQAVIANVTRNDVPIIPGDGLPIIAYIALLLVTTIIAIAALKRGSTKAET